MQYPLLPGQGGHEGWGIVDAVGTGVDDVVPGDRVAFLGDRSWAEYAIAPADQLVALPAELAELPFPGEAFACGFNVFRRSAIQAGQTVAIVGLGFLGAVVCRLASDAGATVIAISRRDSSLALGEDMGASHAIRLGDHRSVAEQVRTLTKGEGCARVIEAVGSQGPLDLAAILCGTRATLVIAGYHQDGPRTVNLQDWNWKGLDVINAHERDPAVYIAGMRAAIDRIAKGGLDPRRLVTHEYPLTLLGRALDETGRKPDGFVKAVVIP